MNALLSKIENIPQKAVLCSLFVFCVIFFAQGLSVHGPEYRDDEIFYYKSTQEMVKEGNFLSPTYFGENRFQKPILFYWLIIIFYKIFGLGWFGARFVSVVSGAFAICVTWLIGKELFDKKTATISSLLLMTVPLFFRHTKNAVPDMTLNFFIVLAMYFALLFVRNSDKNKYAYLFFVCCALGFMIKGFAALVVPVVSLITYSLLTKRKALLKKIRFPIGIVIILVIVLPWFLYMWHLHGDGYMEYMLGTETRDRMVSSSQQNALLKVLTSFRNNSLFYLETLMSYFAPWSGFFIAALPLSLFALIKKKEDINLLFISNWFFVVFLFFSLIHARINHLILVLSTPFAVLVAMFLLGRFDYGNALKRFIVFFRRGMGFIIVFFGVLGLFSVRIFLFNLSLAWLFLFIAILALGIYLLFVRKNRDLTAFFLCFFLLFSYSQAGLITKARLTSISCMQGIAETVKKDIAIDTIVGVGSHDIHEKEFQVYFDRKIKKAATSNADETKLKLKKLFSYPKKVYCLITEKDYKDFLDVLPSDKIHIVSSEQMFRKRVNIDKGFFKALLQFDRKTFNKYMFETVFLLRKG